jgi:hypothetical protein
MIIYDSRLRHDIYQALKNNAISIVVEETWTWMTAVFGGPAKLPFVILKVRVAATIELRY